MSRAFLAVACFAAVLLVACGGGGSKATPTPSPSPSSTSTIPATLAPTATPAATQTPSPTSTPLVAAGHPIGTRTGDSSIDAVIAALEVGDGRAIDALVDWETVPCEASSPGSSEHPACPEGVVAGAAVEAIREIGCEGSWHVRPPDRGDTALAIEPEDRLYSVWKGPPLDELRGADAQIIYVDADRPNRFKEVLLRAGRILMDYRGCDDISDELGWRGGTEVFPPPSR